jgi:hypothetical protein
LQSAPSPHSVHTLCQSRKPVAGRRILNSSARLLRNIPGDRHLCDVTSSYPYLSDSQPCVFFFFFFQSKLCPQLPTTLLLPESRPHRLACSSVAHQHPTKASLRSPANTVPRDSTFSLIETRYTRTYRVRPRTSPGSKPPPLHDLHLAGPCLKISSHYRPNPNLRQNVLHSCNSSQLDQSPSHWSTGFRSDDCRQLSSTSNNFHNLPRYTPRT